MGEGRHGGPKGPRTGSDVRMGIPGAALDAINVVAGALGLEPAELKQELSAGKSLAQIAQERNVNIDALKAELAAQAKTQMEKAVADGKLTADQATTLLAQLTEHFDEMLNMSFKNFMGGMNGERHMLPRMPQAATPAAPIG